MKTIQNLINHIVFVIDGSGSMRGLSNDVVKVFDNQVKYLARRSKEVDQETRVSVYIFNNTIQCLIYDMDVMRLPSLSGFYSPDGGTALIDGTLKAIADLEKTPEIYGDHAFLLYTITDGEENQSQETSSKLSQKITSLPINWTLAVFVPNQTGKFEAKRFGFPADNISIWDTTSKGIKEVDASIQTTTNNFFEGRAKGVRGTKSLFKLNVDVTATEIKENLNELTRKDYYLIPVSREGQIRDIVEKNLKSSYKKGAAFYQLTKPETVQDYKKICIMNKSTRKVYGGDDARSLLGIPMDEVRMSPGDFGKFDIFVQSTSVNRKILAGTNVLVLTNP